MQKRVHHFYYARRLARRVPRILLRRRDRAGRLRLLPRIRQNVHIRAFPLHKKIRALRSIGRSASATGFPFLSDVTLRRRQRIVAIVRPGGGNDLMFNARSKKPAAKYNCAIERALARIDRACAFDRSNRISHNTGLITGH